MEGSFEVFLCHNSADKEAVKAIGRALEQRGLRPWLDEWQLRPGMPWQRQLDRQIKTIRAAAVLVGESGFGPWQSEELESFLQQFVRRGCPVIPVILSGCASAPELPSFLANRTWVDFRQTEPDPVDRLIWGITGEPPAPATGPRDRPPALEPPKPAYPDERSRELSRALDDAYRREEELVARGADPAPARREIVAIQRELREDGLRPGDLLSGRYKLLEPIGQGGFARVWKAWDTRMRQLVALKALHQQYARDRSRRQRFFRGARRMAQLNHPAIARILGEPEMRDGACRFFVMEYAEGGDLRRAVLDGRLDAGERLAIVRAVGAALHHAHRRGIVHRDVKPANVLLDGGGEPKLTDFDLVRAQDSTGGTRTGMLGTVVYAAPEAMERAKEAGVAADVYGLGMTAVFALHGAELPARELLRDAPGFARRLDAPGWVRAALAQAVAWEPEARQGSVAELCDALSEPPGPEAAGQLATETGLEPDHRVRVDDAESSADELDERFEQTEEWEERSKLFRRMPDMAEGSLRQLEALQRRTTDVHDLFFLEEAAREVARRWPKSARRAEQLCKRLYADREPPPKELFSRVETRDGRVDLWRDIPAGMFWMGSPDAEGGRDDDEGPRHDVRISRPSRWMAVPVTNAMYRAFDAAYRPQHWDGVSEEALARHPAVNVDWYQAAAFCRWLAHHGFEGARLPTEAEWEYACRAGTSSRYWSGDSEEDLERIAWYTGNAGARTHRVGSKPANPWGLYDVHGNVWEWCADAWDAKVYSQRARERPAIDPRTEGDVWETRSYRVLRGGSWASPARVLRAAYRSGNWHGDRSGNCGFRVCCRVPEHD